jgi:transcription elongation factor Elf1
VSIPPTRFLPKQPARKDVFAKLYRCPECGSPRLRAFRTDNLTDTDGESLIRHTQCKVCGCKFRLFLE